MSGSRFFRVILAVCALLVSLAAPAMGSEGYPALPGEHPDPVALEAAFDQAAADFGVSVEILKAVAFVESRWVQTGPTIDGGWGIMHLVDNDSCRTLEEAAAASGLSADSLKNDAVANIRGGAALLADLVRRTVGTATTIEEYRPALRIFTGLAKGVQDKQVAEYERVLSEGAEATNGLGVAIVLPPAKLPAGEPTSAQPTGDYVVMSTDYGPAIWNPADSSNYTVGRGGTAIDRWINHWIGVGTYAGAISWFQNPSSNVSAHFVIRKVDGELTQMVRIADTAWHAGNWSYNQRSIGIEHEATTTNPWPTDPSSPMLVNATTCCRYFCDLYGIPKTRTYIIGHNEVPGASTACPGPLPWDTYMNLVNLSGNTPPSITLHPSGLVVPPGGTATFTVGATGTSPLSYQWQKNGSNVTNGGHYSGCTTATLTVSNCDSNDAAGYRCYVSNPYGNATSNSATLTIGTPSSTFIVESRSGGQNFANYSEISGSWSNSTAKSTASGCTSGIGSRYTTIGASGGKATFGFTPVATGTYQIYTTNCSTTNSGNPMIHKVTHAGGTATVSVCQNTTCSPSACNVWLSLGTFTLNAGTAYAVTLDGTTGAGSAPSGNAGRTDAIKWESIQTAQPPTITLHPSNQNVCPGATANFSVTATGDGTLSYQWQKNSINVTNGGHYSGCTTTTLTVSSTDSNDAANYRCTVSNAGGSTNSNQAALTLKAATAITQHPSNQNVCPAATAGFTVAATGDGTLTYQWQKNSVNVTNGGNYSGCTTATLTVSNCDANDAANYRCVVTGGCGNATSNAATLSVTPAGQPGDFDGDTDVDQVDFSMLQLCFGATNPSQDPICRPTDLNYDNVVDDRDLVVFKGCASGPNVPAETNCTNGQ
ncbi:MAG TPA: immunoglobulin domain-containing protein [Phycisphaerae bacterium]|nr:immunoglobulin domain-containing protein [Phycisphaerae bacterium]